LTLFDLELPELERYLPERTEPADFDSFWADTLAEARANASEPVFERVETGLSAVDVFDVTFSGYAGQAVRGWLVVPLHVRGPRPAVVEFIGYGGGRGLPYSWLTWAAAGYVQLVMDTRGQGSVWSPGDTPDLDPEGIGPEHPGFLTRGIFDPARYYYRRVFTDGVMAVGATRAHPAVDPERVLVSGGSQGGGIALATSGLTAMGDGPALLGAMIDVPFLSHIRRAIDLTDDQPYVELTRFLHIHRSRVDDVFRTLSYFDGMNFAARAVSPALFAVGLRDTICPPSTVFASYNHYAGPKEIRIWPFSGHDAGDGTHTGEQLRFAARLVERSSSAARSAERPGA
jgi:cephalosporin-C deacetylase